MVFKALKTIFLIQGYYSKVFKACANPVVALVRIL